jgi:hypothetical protein
MTLIIFYVMVFKLLKWSRTWKEILHVLMDEGCMLGQRFTYACHIHICFISRYDGICITSTEQTLSKPLIGNNMKKGPLLKIFSHKKCGPHDPTIIRIVCLYATISHLWAIEICVQPCVMWYSMASDIKEKTLELKCTRWIYIFMIK